MHPLQRISRRRRDLKEQDTLLLGQALLINRITYGTPYLALKTTEKAQLNTMTCQAYKTVLGLPTYTATLKLLDLGVLNTW